LQAQAMKDSLRPGFSAGSVTPTCNTYGKDAVRGNRLLAAT
jgi:hypothetical protein